MRPKSRLVTLLLAISVLSPAVALAQFGEAWRSSHTNRYQLFGISDLDANGSKDFLTFESEDPSGGFIGVRSAATGALQVQTSARYHALNLFHMDLDGDGPQEMLFLDTMVGRETCVSFTGSPSTLTPRWAIRPFGGNAPFDMFFADLDGNGQQYVIFRAQSASQQFEVYTHLGALFGIYQPNVPMGWAPDYVDIQDFDGDGRDEILLAFRYQDGGLSGQIYILLQSTAPVGVEPGPGRLRAVELGASFPNPAVSSTRIEYRVPSRGPVTLRLLDVAGREVRTLVNGEVAAGRHEATWDGRDAHGRTVAAGAYFYELTAGGETSARRVIRLN